MQVDIPINESILQRLIMVEQKGLLAHAYLFVGQRDIGKKETALSIAQYVNCQDNRQGKACGQCSSCVKITSGNHPDVTSIFTDYGEKIKIEDIRSLLEQERLRPFCGRKKVFIINNVENFTPEAANALLKTLEEPSANSLLILTTSNFPKVLDTIKSRCHSVYFPSVSQRDLEEQLKEKYGNDGFDYQFISYMADGCPGRADKMKKDGIMETKDEIIDGFIFQRDRDSFLKAVTADKIKAKAFLDILLSWCRDAILVKSGIEDSRLVHQDRLKELKQFAGHFSFVDLKDLYDETVKVCKFLAENLNIKIPLLIIKEKLWAR